MAKRQGLPKTGGRRKGTPNRATADVRAAIALIAERNVSKLEQWLTTVAATDPAKAAEIFLRAIEYHIPKLSRAEHTGEGGGPVQVAPVDWDRVAAEVARRRNG